MTSPLSAEPNRRLERVAPRLFLNGKFYSGSINGVHRVADRLLRELDAAAVRGEAPAGWDMRLLLPRRSWAPSFATIRPMPQPIGHSQLWEQIVLPFAARSGALASFANLAPGWHPGQAVMVHDAQFRISPDSYPAKLRLGYRMLIPRGARRSRIVLTVSDYARDSLATFGIGDPARTEVLYNGADHILEQDADNTIIEANDLRLAGYCIAFGSPARYKNLAVVFAAFGQTALADMPLVIVGSSREALAAAGLAAPPNAVFVGGVDDAALRALYENALALLFPSRTEGFGLPPAEAMLCGCPVIAAPAGAVPEICRDAICYAGVDDPADWRRRIADLAPGHPLRAAKIEAGFERAAEFTWRAAGRRLVDLLTPLVDEGRSRTA